MLAPIRTSAPGADLVSLSDAKANLRVTGTSEDDLITALVDSATSYLDGYAGILGRCLVNQDWRASYCNWPERGRIELPFPNVSAVTVKYSDASDVEQTLDSTAYELLEGALGAYIFLRPLFTYPNLYPFRGDPVRIDMTAGYGSTADDVPQAIRSAALLHIGQNYWIGKQSPFLSLVRVEGVSERRYVVSDQSMTTTSKAIDALIAPFRRPRF